MLDFLWEVRFRNASVVLKVILFAQKQIKVLKFPIEIGEREFLLLVSRTVIASDRLV